MRATIIQILLLFSFTSFGQQTTSRYFYSKEGFCSNSVIINSNQTYTEEGGCEGSSHVHFGRWTTLDDTTLQLLPNDIEVLQSISLQKDTSSHECKTVKFKVIDILGEPIASFDISLYKKPIKTNWLIRNPSYNGEQTFETDDAGLLEVNYSSFDSMEFKTLIPYQKVRTKYPLLNFEGKIVVLKLNANKIAFVYPDIEFFKKDKPTIVKLRKKSIAIGDSNDTWILNED